MNYLMCVVLLVVLVGCLRLLPENSGTWNIATSWHVWDVSIAAWLD